MDVLVYIFLIFIAAAIPFMEYFVAIPLGIIAGVPTTIVVFIAIIGNTFSVILLIRFVDHVWDYIHKRKEKKQSKNTSIPFNSEVNEEQEEQSENEVPLDDHAKNTNHTFESKRAQRAKKWWDKYGVPGLAFFGTGLLSSHVTVVMACLFGGNRVYIAIWMTISLAIWSLLYGIAIHFGVDFLLR